MVKEGEWSIMSNTLKSIRFVKDSSIRLLMGAKNMKLKSMDITNVGGISSLHLDFNAGMNVICGENGIGKSTILKCIVNSMDRFNGDVKAKLGSPGGEICFYYGEDLKGNAKKYPVTVNETKPELQTDWRNADNTNYIPGEILFFDTEREINYKKIDQIDFRDSDYPNIHNESMQFSKGIKIDRIKDWFIWLCMQHGNQDCSWNEVKEEYYLSATSLFAILSNGDVKYHNIDDREVMLKPQQGDTDIYFEYLSSGYKSCVYIVWGIIKEIEARFKNRDNIKEKLSTFNGLVVIDEIDLHLHPIWQSRIVDVLKQLLPQAQFFLTTHSPCILQNLKKNEIVALARDNGTGNVYQKELNLDKYGLQGWTFEEILTDVMGSKTLRSSTYNDMLGKFTDAIDNDDKERINEYYKELDRMLHPNNPLRTIFSMQKDGIGND